MKNLEPIFHKINELLIEELPRQIDLINKEINDGIILEQFKNINPEEKCENLPCYECSLNGVEYSQKDRIIETAVLSMTVKVKLKPNCRNKTERYIRYTNAIFHTFYDTETDLWCDIYVQVSTLDSIKLNWKIEI